MTTSNKEELYPFAMAALVLVLIGGFLVLRKTRLAKRPVLASSPGDPARVRVPPSCKVQVRRVHGDLFAKDWREVWGQVSGGAAGCGDKPGVSTEEEARAYACGGCGVGANGAWRKGTCEEDTTSWTVDLGSRNCVSYGASIERREDGRYYVNRGPDQATLHEEPGYFRETRSLTLKRLLPKPEPGEASDEQLKDDPCQRMPFEALPGGESETFYDAAGRALYEVQIPLGVEVAAMLDGDTLVLHGSGCDGRWPSEKTKRP